MGCPTHVEIGNNLVFSIATHNPDTAVLTDADSLPIYRVYENDNTTPILTGSMSKLDDDNTTGFYIKSIACTLDSGFEVDKIYTIYIAATINGDTGGITYNFIVCDTAVLVSNAVMRRDMSNVEDTADEYSLCTLILAGLNSNISNTTRYIKKTTGLEYLNQTVTVDANANPITGVS